MLCQRAYERGRRDGMREVAVYMTPRYIAEAYPNQIRLAVNEANGGHHGGGTFPLYIEAELVATWGEDWRQLFRANQPYTGGAINP